MTDVVETTPAKPTKDTRISPVLSKQVILMDFLGTYLSVFDEISAYNKEVLAEKSSDWPISKIMEKAREFASPENADDIKPEVKVAWDQFEAASQAMQVARRNVLNATAKELGITLSVTAERNSDTEAPLKEHRTRAVAIGKQLSTFSELLNDEKISAALKEFLDAYPLPAVGRDQVSNFGADEKSTPKYRVTVVVTNSDGEELVNESGFTKAALALTKFYPRGEAPKPDTLRTAWEKAGNTGENTVQPVVEFDDNDLHYVITKK